MRKPPRNPRATPKRGSAILTNWPRENGGFPPFFRRAAELLDMAGRPDSFMAIFWGDYARDTAHLDAEGHGAYLMLIKHYWCHGAAIKDDNDKLWKISTCRSLKAWLRLRPTIEEFFQISDGYWHHKRIDQELSAAEKRYAQRSLGARIANAKRGAERTHSATPSDTQSATLSERSSSTERSAEGALRARASQPQPQESPPPPARLAGRRENGTNPRSLGTNPRTLGTNPRATGDNPQALASAPWPETVRAPPNDPPDPLDAPLDFAPLAAKEPAP